MRGTTLAPDPLPSVPAMLKAIPNWVSWKLVNGDKPLFIVGTDRYASSTDSSTWTDFSTAVAKSTINCTEGVGFVIGGTAIEKEIVGVDVDGCLNPNTDEITPWAEKIVDSLDSYTERTPSGLGLRVWVTGQWPFKEHVFNLDPEAGFGDKVKVEVYTRARYYTITGDAWYDCQVEIERRDLSGFHNLCRDIQAQWTPKAKATSTSPGSIGEGVKIEPAPAAPITDKYELLMHGIASGDKPLVIADGFGNSLTYDDRSAADMALCTSSALRHGDNPDAIWKDYENSSLFRPKWENREDDFRRLTIAKAIATTQKLKDAQPAATVLLNGKIANIPESQSSVSSSITQIQAFVSVDGDMFMKENIPPRKTLIQLIDTGFPIFTAQSINQIFAWRGLGKTCTGFGLTAAFATGGHFLNWKAPQRCRVLYIEGELPAAQAQERWKQIVGPTNGYARLITVDKQPNHVIPSLATPRGMAMVEKTLAELENGGFKVDVLILDSISTLFNIVTNDEEGWIAIQAWLISLRSRGLCIFFYHHAGKSGLSRSHSKSEDMLDISIKLDFPAEQDTKGLHVLMHYDKARAGFSEPDCEIKMKRAHSPNCPCVINPHLIGCPGDSVIWDHKLPGDHKKFEAERRFASGKSNAEVAEELDIQPSTVRSWRNRWKKKADVLADL